MCEHSDTHFHRCSGQSVVCTFAIEGSFSHHGGRSEASDQGGGGSCFVLKLNSVKAFPGTEAASVHPSR